MRQAVTGCDSDHWCFYFAEVFQERRGLRVMTRHINVLDCQPDVLLLELPHIENKLAQASLQEFYGRHKIPMDPAATLFEHHAPLTSDI